MPDWSKDAVWYQIFPERFRNACPVSDPVMADISDRPVAGWGVTPWGMDWYGRAPWESRLGGFYKSVYHRRYGGDLPGVISKLDYLRDLGVNAIYLNPVFWAPSLHKYDAACLHHVDPTLGPDRAGDIELIARAGETHHPGTWVWTSADRCLAELIRETHRRGMRIILDGVFNHTGTRFFAFRDIQRHGRESAYADWYRITKWHDDRTFDYEGWFGFKGLPELGRTDDDLHAAVREYIFAITRRWMDPDGDGDPSDGVDGWRLDVAFCVPHGFWKKWRAHVKSINPEAYLTAEVVSRADDFLRGDEFDAVMNYMWLFPSARFFMPAAHTIGAPEFRRELDALRKAYPPDVTLALQNLLDSHDVGRIATVLENRLPLDAGWDSYFNLSRASGNDKLSTRRPGEAAWRALRQLIVFQMTYPGAPMLYYGTEVGMWGANDPDNRQPMLWDDIEYEPESHDLNGRCPASPRGPDKDLFRFCRKAIALRKKERLLRRGGLRWLASGSPRVLAFARTDGDREIRVYLNAGDEPRSVKLERAGRDLWNAGRRVAAGRLSIEPRGWRVVAVRRGR